MTFRLALPLLAALASPVAALDLAAMTEAETDAFGVAVRAYLMDNPQVLIEVIGLLEAQEEAATAAADNAMALANADALFNDPSSWVGGNPDGDVVMVEFMDYRCGYCKRAFEEVAALLETDGNIRFIVKEFPILGEQSVMASQFAIAVLQLHGDAAYADVHDALMTIESDISTATLSRLAEAFLLDPAPIITHMASPEVAAVIAENRALADAMQISGTPTFVLEGQMLRGYVPLAQMQALVAEVRLE